MKYEQIGEGEVYKASYPNQGWYFVRRGNGGYLNINGSSYSFLKMGGNITPSNGFKKFEYPTEKELWHFLQCEKAGKYVEYKPELIDYQVY